jgi:subtilisin family serine protease
VLFAVGNDNMPISPFDPTRLVGVIAVGASNNVGGRSGYSNTGDSVDRADEDINRRTKRISVLACSDGTSSDEPFRREKMRRHRLENPRVGPFEDDGSTENIYTTDISGQPGYNPIKPGDIPSAAEPDTTPISMASAPDYTGLMGGTSAACPLAAGVCALMLSVNADLTRAQVKYVLEATADKLGTGQARVDSPPGRIPAGKAARYEPATGHDPAFGFGRVNAEQAVIAARGGLLRQFVCTASPGAYAEGIPIVLRRVAGNRFVSDQVIELVDARRDAEALVSCPPPATPPTRVSVRGGPGGFLRATFQPAGVGPLMSDEVDIEGQPV